MPEITPVTRSGYPCECCGKRITAVGIAAAVLKGEGRRLVWCFDCWDTDPKAVTQYREASVA